MANSNFFSALEKADALSISSKILSETISLEHKDFLRKNVENISHRGMLYFLASNIALLVMVGFRMAYVCLSGLGTFNLEFIHNFERAENYFLVVFVIALFYLVILCCCAVYLLLGKSLSDYNKTRIKFVSIVFFTTLVWLFVLSIYHHQVIYAHSNLRSIMPALLVLIPLVYIGAILVIPYFSISMLFCLVINQLSDERAFTDSWVLQGGMLLMLVTIIGGIFLMVRRAIGFIAEVEFKNFKLTEKLIHTMNMDVLLAIPNRQAFFSRVSNKLTRKKEESSPVCILMIDVDHFKKYNDFYGHPAGDSCLQQVAACLKSCLREDIDMVGRYGGEEFIVFLDDANIEGATVVAERIVTRIAQLNLRHEKSTTAEHVTLSIGIAPWHPGATLELLCERADQALYQAKHGGRNRYVVYSE